MDKQFSVIDYTGSVGKFAFRGLLLGRFCLFGFLFCKCVAADADIERTSETTVYVTSLHWSVIEIHNCCHE